MTAVDNVLSGGGVSEGEYEKVNREVARIEGEPNGHRQTHVRDSRYAREVLMREFQGNVKLVCIVVRKRYARRCCIPAATLTDRRHRRHNRKPELHSSPNPFTSDQARISLPVFSGVKVADPAVFSQVTRVSPQVQLLLH